MASNKKIDRAMNGPGLFEITLGVLLSLVLGVLLAALHLIFKPVTVVADKLPDTVERGDVYFVEGSTNSSKARQVARKRQMLIDGGSAEVMFNEDELNSWIATATEKAEAGAGAVAGIYEPERINFRVRDSQLQIGLLGKLKTMGINQDLVFQTRGSFVASPEGFRFTADEFYIGSLPTHVVPGLTPFLISRIVAAQELPADLQATWKKLKVVAVEGNSLRLVLP